MVLGAYVQATSQCSSSMSTNVLIPCVQDSAPIRRHLLSGARACHRRCGRPRWSWWSGSHGWSGAALRLSWLHPRPVPRGLGGVWGAERVADQPGSQPRHLRLKNLGHVFMHLRGNSAVGFLQTSIGPLTLFLLQLIVTQVKQNVDVFLSMTILQEFLLLEILYFVLFYFFQCSCSPFVTCKYVC